MSFTSILALTDFSADGDKAVERAAQIALGHGAVLRLLALPDDGCGPGPELDTRLGQAAKAVAVRLGLTVHPVGVANGGLDALAVHARAADLLVIPQRSVRTLSSWLAGPDAIRILRACRCPVLVARGAVRRRIRHIVVGVDFTPAAHHRAMLACMLDRDAEVELFHAIDMSGESHLRQAEVVGDAIRNYRESCMEYARLRLRWMTQSLLANGHAVLSAAMGGDPAQQLVARQQWVGADLLVVGKQRRHALFDCVLGSTAHQVLDQARSDVLLVPHDFELSGSRVKVQPAVQQDPAMEPLPA